MPTMLDFAIMQRLQVKISFEKKLTKGEQHGMPRYSFIALFEQD